MKISDFLLEFLKKEYNNGATQCEMAEKHGVNQTYIQNLLSGKRKPSGVSIGMLETMFPGATIDLTGHGNLGNQQINRDQATGIQNISTAPPPSLPSEEQCAACRHKLQDAVMSSDMDASSKVKAYGIIGGGGGREI